jgi:DNA-directed RNA polymerase subunit RPC12/RpoP
MTVTKRCVVCGRFRAYDEDDAFCVGCGNEALEAHCHCGRDFSYALAEEGDVHCPRCGRVLRGRAPELES